jgi:hypothetical protein
MRLSRVNNRMVNTKTIIIEKQKYQQKSVGEEQKTTQTKLIKT